MVHRNLSIPLKKKRKEKKREASEETLLLEQKKKDKGEGWRSQDQTPLNGHSSITHMHMTSQRRDF